MPSIWFIDERSSAELVSAKKHSSACRVFHIDLSSVSTELDVFRAFAAAAPMGDCKIVGGEPWQNPQNWAAFADFLYEGIVDLEESPVALVLRGVQTAANGNLPLIINLIQSLTATEEAISEAVEKISLRIFILGTGPGFEVCRGLPGLDFW